MVESELRGWVRTYLAKLVGLAPEAVTFDKTLGTYGLDSVDAVLMAGEMEDALGIEVDPTIFLQHPTLDAMIDALEQVRSGAPTPP